MYCTRFFSLELKFLIIGLCIYLSHAQRGHQRGNSHGPAPHRNTNSHGPPSHRMTNSHGPPPHQMSNSHGPPPHQMSNSHGPPTHRMTNSHGQQSHPPSRGASHQLSSGHHIGKTKFYHVTKNKAKTSIFKYLRETTTVKFVKDNNESAIPTDIPEEKEIGEDPTTSADGLTQRTESPHGTDPIEQRDPIRTTPMPASRRGGALPPPPPPRYSVGGHSRGAQHHVPTYPPTHAPRPRPRPKPTTRKDPIVHARTTTPEPPKPTEAGEVEYENEGGSTTVGYQGGGRGGGGRRNQRRNQQGGGGGYYNDYHDRTNQKENGSNKTSGNGSSKTSGEEFQGACPRFKETIIDHHVILRQHGCEIVISQDDAIRRLGSPGLLPPIAFARNT